MKAVVCTKYGPPEVLQIREVDKLFPKENKVLIKVHATTVHVGDSKIRCLKPALGAYRDFFFKLAMRIMMGSKTP